VWSELVQKSSRAKLKVSRNVFLHLSTVLKRKKEVPAIRVPSTPMNQCQRLSKLIPMVRRSMISRENLVCLSFYLLIICLMTFLSLDHALHQQCNSFNTQLRLELACSNTVLVEWAHDYLETTKSQDDKSIISKMNWMARMMMSLAVNGLDGTLSSQLLQWTSPLQPQSKMSWCLPLIYPLLLLKPTPRPQLNQ
jgi:hypothetical protein